MAGTIVFIVTVLIVISVAAVLVMRRPKRGPELEPPPEPRTPTATVEAPPAEVDEATVAEIEDALAEPPPAPPEVVAPPLKPSFRDRLSKARSVLSGYVG